MRTPGGSKEASGAHQEPAPHGEPAVKFDKVESRTVPAGLAFG
jgi:hypothetical protein